MPNSRFFYGFDWSYGVGTWWQNSDGTEIMPGRLMVFDSCGARDKWVEDDVFDGNYHRSAIDAITARGIMVDDVFFENPCCNLATEYETRGAAKRWASTREIVEAWRELQSYEAA